MRTTITLEDDVYAVARDLAEKQDTTLGQAVSILIRRGYGRSRETISYPDGFEPFRGSPDDPIITLDLVNELLDESI